MKKNKKTLYWSLTVVGLLIIGILIIKSAVNKEESLPVAKKYAVVVSTIQPKMEETQLTLPYLAITQNDKDVKLASKIPSRVNYIKSSGSKVKIGEVIARLDNTTIIGNLKSVEAQKKAMNKALSNLNATHKRTQELYEVKGASIEQLQMEESKIAELESKVETLNQKDNELKDMLTYAVIKSPVNGRISMTMVNKGDMAMPGHPVATLSAENGFFLLLRVPTDIKIYSVILNGKTYDAIPLNSTFNSLAQYKVYVDAENMTSGDRVEVDVVIYKGEAVKLPFDTILNRDGKSFVLIRENNIAVPKEIKIIQSGEDGAVVADNSLVGKELVVAKQDILLKLLSGNSLMVKED